MSKQAFFRKSKYCFLKNTLIFAKNRSNPRDYSLNSQEYESIKQNYPTYSYPHLNPNYAMRNSIENNFEIPQKNNIFTPDNPTNLTNMMTNNSNNNRNNRYFANQQKDPEPFLNNNPNNFQNNKEKSEDKPNFARNIRGRLGFWSDSPEELMKKEQQKNEYKEYIENQIAEKKKKEEYEKNVNRQLELKEENRIKQQLDDMNHYSSDSKIFDKSFLKL